MHGDSTVADNTNVDIYAVDGPVLRQITTIPARITRRGIHQTNHLATYLSMERAGFEGGSRSLDDADHGGCPDGRSMRQRAGICRRFLYLVSQPRCMTRS